MGFSFGFRTLCSPKDDVQGEILKEVGAADHTILMLIYGFHLPALTDLLIAKHKAGVNVQCILDLTQSKGKAEEGEVQRLVDAGVDVTIGTSPVHHAIMHEKGFCLDGMRTITGSYNFSQSAAGQVNHCDFVYSNDRALWFMQMFNNLHDWIEANEPDCQPKKVASPA